MDAKEVVIILPYQENRVLLQLRDFKPNIEYPGCWGFWGGGLIEENHLKKLLGGNCMKKFVISRNLLQN